VDTLYRELPFKRAIEFLQQRVPLPTETWTDLSGMAQEWAFTVAGLTSAQLLQSVYDLTTQAVENGMLISEFQEQFDSLYQRSGYAPMKPWRSQLVLLQNMRTAYGAGRWRQMTDPEVMARSPYWQWVHDDPITPRPHHLALHLKVFRADDPFWLTCYPPSGFNCRCKVFRLSDRQLRAENLRVEDAPAPRQFLDRATGERISVPAITVGDKTVPIAEAGFQYAPGSSDRQQRAEILEKSINRLNPRLQAVVREYLARGPIPP
jgi:SPP1 gp7 family putative phage head morphogenesis protein